MTEFNMPEDVMHEALMLNALYYLDKTAEQTCDLLAKVLNKMSDGQVPPPDITFDLFSKMAHEWMTVSLLVDEMKQDCINRPEGWAKENADHRDQIQEAIKETPFMKRLKVILKESMEERAIRMLSESADEGMPKEMVDEILAIMKGQQ